MDLYKAPRSTLIIIALLLLLSACGPSVEELQSKGDVDQLLEIFHNQNKKDKERWEAYYALQNLSAQAVKDFAQDALGVCSGNAMAGAGTYVPDFPGPKPLMYVNTGDSYFENTIGTLSESPVDWLPYKRGDLQAIVCMRIDRILLQTCSYTGGRIYTVERWKSTVEVTIREAATGEVIGSFAFDGDDPEPCPYSVTGNSSRVSSAQSIIDLMIENLAQLGFDIMN